MRRNRRGWFPDQLADHLVGSRQQAQDTHLPGGATGSNAALNTEYPYLVLDTFEMRLIALRGVGRQKICDPGQVIYLLGEADLITLREVLNPGRDVDSLTKIVEAII